MKEYIQVVTTVGDKETAQKIALALAEKRLAGCVQVIGPITSIYRWKGEVETAEEWLCVSKSRIDLYQELEKSILQIHPYEVPEILAVPILEGSQSYLEWLNNELKEKKQ